MKFNKGIGIGIMLALLLSACVPVATTTPTATINTPVPQLPTAIPKLPTAALPTVALPTLTPVPLNTLPAVPTATQAVAPGTQPDYSSGAYLDDRSTPSTLLLSYVNAINRHEYVRAYSYWSMPASSLGTLSAFTTGYNNTVSIAVVLGSLSSEGAAGSIYYTVPAVLTASQAGGGTDRYAACYIMRLSQPGNYGAPPISPMGIEKGIANLVSASTSDDNALASACSGPDFTPGPNPANAYYEVDTDLSKDNYIDNRSGPVQVVSSLLNSLNRKEYVRAYSYWQNPSSTVGSYDAYAAGYSDTETVTAVFGTITSDAGAGQFHYQLPLAMIVKTTTNATQTFVGCYTLHLSNPGIQGTLPFEPLGITAGHFTKVANSIDVNPLLATACK